MIKVVKISVCEKIESGDTKSLLKYNCMDMLEIVIIKIRRFGLMVEFTKDNVVDRHPEGAILPGMDSPDAITLVGRSRLSQALELEEKPDNRYLRLSLYVLGAAALIFFPWAALTPITQVVNASGEVIPEGEVTVVQHLEGGIVSRVDVSDGDEVRVGEVMLELRPNLVESEYRATEQQLKNLLLQQQQLQD